MKIGGMPAARAAATISRIRMCRSAATFHDRDPAALGQHLAL